MTKTKIALIIIKLLGITALLFIALITILLIEFLTQERQTNFPNQPLFKPIVPIKFPNFKPQWMIDLLPRDYLNIKHLKAWAKQRRIKNYSKLSKSNLILDLSPAG